MIIKFAKLLPLLLVSIVGFSQNVDLFCEKKQIVWCGVDFSMARFMGTFAVSGDKAKLTPQELKGYFEIWNSRIVNENNKVNYKTSLGFQKIIDNLEITKQRNDSVNPAKMIIFEYYSLTELQIDSIVRKYPVQNNEKGLGLTFIVEYLDKVHVTASVFVVFFDVETKKIFFKQNVKTKPVGVGQSNYWLNSFLQTFLWIEKKGIPLWEKQYCKR